VSAAHDQAPRGRRRAPVARTRLPRDAGDALALELLRDMPRGADDAIGRLVACAYAVQEARVGSNAERTALLRLGDVVDELRAAGVRP
jgi:hypothetical protein